MEHRFPTCDEELQLLRASATLWPGLGKIEVIILLRNCELLAQLIELRLFFVCYSRGIQTCTHRISLMTIAALPVVRGPALLAKALAALDVLSGGRLVVGEWNYTFQPQEPPSGSHVI